MEETYRQRLKHFEERTRALDKKSAALANGRLLFFLLAAGFALATTFNKVPSWGWAIAGVTFVIFLGLATWHTRVIDEERRSKASAALNQRGLDRLAGAWTKFTARGDPFLSADHLYTPDLDVFGQGSLFQRLDETATKAGERLLASWLLGPAPSAEEIVSRQTAAAELARHVDFRQALLTEARVASEDRADPSRFIAWVEGPALLRGIRWARPLAFVLPLLTLTLGMLTQYDVLPSPLFATLSFGAQMLVAGVTWAACSKFYGSLTDGHGGFVRFERTFAAVTAQPFEGARLKGLREKAGASTKLARFGRLFSFAELRSSGQYHAVINVLLLWDLHWLFRLEDWRVSEGKNVREWFDALAELEALAAIGTWVAERPGDTFPEIVAEPAVFEAKALGHPLLREPVMNDVSLSRQVWVITGSNMSGKTTLLRAVGLNTVMALAGMPVCASSLKVSMLAPMTSMRVKDSLERGVSYFYAEVQRIKAVLDAAKEKKGHALFLLDELLMGTNTKERQIASRRLIELLRDAGAIGGVTTHDLVLTETGGVKNVHFRDDVKGGQMVFDYRLRDGVVETTNALRLLEAAGVPL
ncbi:MAG: DNA mismatch repair protein MutS [Myxococcaceae bacterium]|nr:DNA mismatch repair protein MutS [Myxococcaceae bacterium]